MTDQEHDPIVADDPLNNIDGKKPVPDMLSDLSPSEVEQDFVPMPADFDHEWVDGSTVKVPPELVGDPLPMAQWFQHNTVLNAIADAQGIEPGSWPWLQGGVAAFSGQSGEHASYGWRHHHKVNSKYVRQVLANYGHRRSYYTNAPFRSFDYYAGGRPKGWTPEIPGDKPDGSADYVTSTGIVTVTGPEAEHFWLDPLWAVLDSPAVPVSTPFGQFTSRSLAGIMAKFQVANIMGAIRDPATGKPYPWTYGGRANSRILDTWLQALKRGAMSPQDFTTGMEFIVNRLLPHYERAPGIDSFGTAPSGMFPVGCFNGLYWLLPVFCDAVNIVPQKPIKARFQTIVDRWSQWALELEETVPGRGFDMGRFYVPRAEFLAQWPKPLDSIKPLLDPENILFDPWTWEVWSFRAADVAATVSGSLVLKAARDKLFAKHGSNASNKKWMVGADREYVQ